MKINIQFFPLAGRGSRIANQVSQIKAQTNPTYYGFNPKDWLTRNKPLFRRVALKAPRISDKRRQYYLNQLTEIYCKLDLLQNVYLDAALEQIRYLQNPSRFLKQKIESNSSFKAWNKRLFNATLKRIEADKKIIEEQLKKNPKSVYCKSLLELINLHCALREIEKGSKRDFERIFMSFPAKSFRANNWDKALEWALEEVLTLIKTLENIKPVAIKPSAQSTQSIDYLNSLTNYAHHMNLKRPSLDNKANIGITQFCFARLPIL
jgi:hypothetical protein